ncbi:MAG TPA: winged helix-turn-helix domain-containing protein [Stellaceae bacterium]|nr:winged helix-turn-helix domain-containing protein [Stellaceae bacterium]
MAGTVAIIIANDDFTIPGSAPGVVADGTVVADPEARFFALLNERNPDVVVLDFSRRHASGLDVIGKIRARSETPILVVMPADGAGLPDFRGAGAAECIRAPVDILAFSQVLQRIVASRRSRSSVAAASRTLSFAGISLQEYGSCLAGPNGNAAKLTTSEARVLAHLMSKPLIVCSRGEIGEMLYGRHRPNSERAIDIIINRLRKKLITVAGPDGQNLIKTEFRRGYTLAAELVESRGKVGHRDGQAIPIIASSAA